MRLFTHVTMLAALAGVAAAPAAFAEPPAVAQEPAAAEPAPSPAPEPAAAPEEASGPTVVYTTRPTPPAFVLMTPAQGGFAVVGALAAMSASKQMALDLQLTEPANEISAAFAAAYVSSKGGRVLERPLVITEPKTDLLKANAAADQAQYVIDVGPAGVNVTYLPLDWGRYSVLLTAGARVFDASTGKLVLKGGCQHQSDKGSQAPTKDQLLANQGAGLKAMIATASQACAAQLEQKLLSN